MIARAAGADARFVPAGEGELPAGTAVRYLRLSWIASRSVSDCRPSRRRSAGPPRPAGPGRWIRRIPADGECRHAARRRRARRRRAQRRSRARSRRRRGRAGTTASRIPVRAGSRMTPGAVARPAKPTTRSPARAVGPTRVRLRQPEPGVERGGGGRRARTGSWRRRAARLRPRPSRATVCPASVSSGRAGRLGSNRSRTTSQPTKRRTPRMPSTTGDGVYRLGSGGSGRARRWGRRRAEGGDEDESTGVAPEVEPAAEAPRGGREREGRAAPHKGRDRSCRSGREQRRREHELDRPPADDPGAEIDIARRALRQLEAGVADQVLRRPAGSASRSASNAVSSNGVASAWAARRKRGQGQGRDAAGDERALLTERERKPRWSSWRRADECAAPGRPARARGSPPSARAAPVLGRVAGDQQPRPAEACDRVEADHGERVLAVARALCEPGRAERAEGAAVGGDEDERVRGCAWARVVPPTGRVRRASSINAPVPDALSFALGPSRRCRGVR